VNAQEHIEAGHTVTLYQRGGVAVETKVIAVDDADGGDVTLDVGTQELNWKQVDDTELACSCGETLPLPPNYQEVWA
jgi:hypothetical protein